eukprot:3511620-Karenia_brevis.AAC.1
MLRRTFLRRGWQMHFAEKKTAAVVVRAGSQARKLHEEITKCAGCVAVDNHTLPHCSRIQAHGINALR